MSNLEEKRKREKGRTITTSVHPAAAAAEEVDGILPLETIFVQVVILRMPSMTRAVRIWLKRLNYLSRLSITFLDVESGNSLSDITQNMDPKILLCSLELNSFAGAQYSRNFLQINCLYFIFFSWCLLFVWIRLLFPLSLFLPFFLPSWLTCEI